MTIDDAIPAEDRIIELLAAYDDLLAGQGTGARSPEPTADADVRRQLSREMECIQLLHRLGSRSLESVDPDDGDSDCGPSPERDRPAAGHTTRFGRFQIRRPLGQGAYGVVFLAHDPILGREVALKVPRPDVVVSDELRQRFLREARAAAGLDHPNVVAVYEAGHVGTVCYIAESFCRGATLAQWLKQRGEPVSAHMAAALLAALADGIAHAHARGVLHRDLKPSNILLDVPAERSADECGLAPGGLGFIPRISDFGLAKLIDKGLDRTRSGVLLGTVNYMAPEQAAAGNDEVGAGADIYALGVILYELITGRPPFQGESPLEILQQLREADVVPPTRLRGEIPRDLETICLKCLEKHSSQRYGSAESLGADLRRFLRSEPIHARPISRVQRVWRWCRRNPALACAATLAVFALFLSAGLSVSFALYQASANERLAHAAARLNVEQQQTRAALETAQKQYIVAEQRWVMGALDRALALCEQGDVTRGMLWLARSLKTVAALPTAEAGDIEYVIRANLGAWQSKLMPLRATLAHDSEIEWLVFNHDGTMILTDGADDHAKVWDARSGRQVGPPLEHPSNIISAAFSPCGKMVLIGCADHSARLWEIATGKLIGEPLVHPAPIHSVAFRGDGRLAVTGSEGLAHVWDLSSAAQVVEPLSHTPGAAISAAAFIPNSSLLLTGCWDHRARLWDTNTGRLVAVLQHEGPVNCVAVSPDSEWVVTGSKDKTVRIWNSRTGQPMGEPLEHPSEVIAVSYGRDTRVLLTVCRDRRIRVWDTVSGVPTWSALLSTLTASFVGTLSPGGTSVVAASGAEPAHVWDVVLEPRPQPILPHPGPVRAVAFSPDGKYVLTGCMDHAARLWDVSTCSRVGSDLRHEARVLAVAFRPDGNMVATCSADRTARLWDAHRGTIIAPPLAHNQQVNAVAFSPDGRTLITACKDGSVLFWEAESGERLAAPELRHQSAVQDVAFSPDGRTIVTLEEAGVARLWNAATGRELDGCMHDEGKSMRLAISPNGKNLVTGGNRMSACLWDLTMRRRVGQPVEHRGAVIGVAFSPDNRMVLTGSDDGPARFWDAVTLRPIGPPLVHQRNVSAVAFSPSGRKIMTGGWDNAAHLWPVPVPIEGAPDMVEADVERLTGMHLHDDGTIHWVDSGSWHERTQ